MMTGQEKASDQEKVKDTEAPMKKDTNMEEVFLTLQIKISTNAMHITTPR